MFFCKRENRNKSLGVAFLLLFLLAGGFVWWMYHPRPEPKFGITFSSSYTKELGLKTEETFRAVVQDLGVHYVRLPLYWDTIEQEKGQYDWSEQDALMAIAEANGVQITIVVGQKVPRWPECHIPDWVLTLNDQGRKEALQTYIKAAVERYRVSSSLVRWQVENEPFFDYGICPAVDPEGLQETIALVRSQDDHPVQLTVSGELESWWPLARQAEVLGFSLYQVTWSDVTGYFVYPIPPVFYRLRALVASIWTDQVIVSELQAEPWFIVPLKDKPLQEWYTLFDEDALRDRVRFTEDIGVSEVYLWGAEWWYYLKINGFDGLWNEARNIFGVKE